jgi:hypothetical protein
VRGGVKDASGTLILVVASDEGFSLTTNPSTVHSSLPAIMVAVGCDAAERKEMTQSNSHLIVWVLLRLSYGSEAVGSVLYRIHQYDVQSTVPYSTGYRYLYRYDTIRTRTDLVGLTFIRKQEQLPERSWTDSTKWAKIKTVRSQTHPL